MRQSDGEIYSTFRAWQYCTQGDILSCHGMLAKACVRTGHFHLATYCSTKRTWTRVALPTRMQKDVKFYQRGKPQHDPADDLMLSVSLMAPLCSDRGESGSRLEPSQFHQHCVVSSATLPCLHGSSPPAAIFCLLFPGVATPVSNPCEQPWGASAISTPPSTSNLKCAETNAKTQVFKKEHIHMQTRGLVRCPPSHNPKVPWNQIATIWMGSAQDTQQLQWKPTCTHTDRWHRPPRSKVLGFTWTDKALWSSFHFKCPGVCIHTGFKWSYFTKELRSISPTVLHSLNSNMVSH